MSSSYTIKASQKINNYHQRQVDRVKVFLYAYIVLIMIFSLAPVQMIFPQALDQGRWALPIFNIIPADKLTHYLMYLILSFLSLLQFKNVTRVLISTILFGAVMEILQAFIPYRTYELNDLIANSIGAFTPSLVFRQKK